MPIRGGGSPGRRSRRAQLSNRLCSSSLARPSETPSPRGPQAAIAGAVAVRVRGPVKAVRREERAMESKSSEGKSMPEEGTIGGKPTPEERVTEGKPTPEGAVMEGKSVAAECKRTGSHEAAGACECGSTKAAPSEATAEAAAKGRPSEAATAEAATAKAATAKCGPTKAAATKAAVEGRSAERRGCRGNRRGGQSDYYTAHHDAHSLSGDARQPLCCKTRQFVPSCRCGTVARVVPNNGSKQRGSRRSAASVSARECDRLLVS